MSCEVSFINRILVEPLNHAFYKLGVFIAKHHWHFIIAPFLVSLLCITGLQQKVKLSDSEYLFAPTTGKSQKERELTEEHFKTNYSENFNAARTSRAGRMGQLLILAKNDAENLLVDDMWKKLINIDTRIKNIEITYDGDTFKYENLCAKFNNKCYRNEILDVYDILTQMKAANSSFLLSWPVAMHPGKNKPYVLSASFGGTQRSEDDKFVKSVPSIRLSYYLNTDPESNRIDTLGDLWEKRFIDEIEDLQDEKVCKKLSIAKFTSKSLDYELDRNSKSVEPYFTFDFVLMGAFSMLACMMGDTVRSKPWIGLLGIMSAAVSTGAAFGIAMYFKINFIGINAVVPFLMVGEYMNEIRPSENGCLIVEFIQGIGIDDTFVTLAAWRKTTAKLNVIERMGCTMEESAVSITISSLTNVISFALGIFCPFPAVQIFCQYAAISVACVYLNHITFFTGWLAVFAYLEDRNLHGTFGFKVMPVSVAITEERSWLYRKFVTGGINKADADNPKDNKEHVLMLMFRDYVAAVINNGCMKLIIVLLFAGYLAIACYGVTQLKEGLERKKIVKHDSYLIDYFEREDQLYREFLYRIQVIITTDMYYYEPSTREKIEKTMKQLEKSTFIGSKYPMLAESWLRSFLTTQQNRSHYDSERHFISLVEQFLKNAPNPSFQLDVKFNKAKTRIIASRFIFQAVNVTNTTQDGEMVEQLRDICDDSPLKGDIKIYHPLFVFVDQYSLIRPTSLNSLYTGAICMMIVSFFFIPNLLCSLWITVSVLSIEIGVIGYMALWDVNLDAISMINLIMCMGFSIDYTAHIVHVFMHSHSGSSKTRVRDALYSMGLPIMQGALSTILGVSALTITNSYVFLVFFKMIFLVITIGSVHGLFLLPVMLSILGPNSCGSGGDDENHTDHEDVDIVEHEDDIYDTSMTLKRLKKNDEIYDSNEEDGDYFEVNQPVNRRQSGMRRFGQTVSMQINDIMKELKTAGK